VLGLQDCSRRVCRDRKRDRRLDRNGFRGFQNMQTHRVARRVVQDAGEVIETHDQMEPPGQVMEERR